MKTASLVALAIGSVLGVGCARFQHQTAETEPHGLICLAEYADPQSGRGVVERVDGLPVRPGHEYRVTPGDHAVTVVFVDTVTDTYEPVGFSMGSARPDPPPEVTVSQDGGVSSTGTSSPFEAFEPMTLKVQSRRVRHADYTIRVRPGWRYELDGDSVIQRPPASP